MFLSFISQRKVNWTAKARLWSRAGWGFQFCSLLRIHMSVQEITMSFHKTKSCHRQRQQSVTVLCLSAWSRMMRCLPWPLALLSPAQFHTHHMTWVTASPVCCTSPVSMVTCAKTAAADSSWGRGPGRFAQSAGTGGTTTPVRRGFPGSSLSGPATQSRDRSYLT